MNIISYIKNGAKSPYQTGERWTREDKIAVLSTSNPKKSEKITMASNPITMPEFILREGIRKKGYNGWTPSHRRTRLYVTRTFDVKSRSFGSIRRHDVFFVTSQSHNPMTYITHVNNCE